MLSAAAICVYAIFKMERKFSFFGAKEQQSETRRLARCQKNVRMIEFASLRCSHQQHICRLVYRTLSCHDCAVTTMNLNLCDKIETCSKLRNEKW